MTSPTFGLTFNRDDTDPRPVIPTDMSVVGLTLPADDADASFLPLNEPVAFDSSDQTALGKLGDTHIAHAVSAIDAQLADFQRAARIVVVRVAKGANAAETISNICGSASAETQSGHIGTGLHALLRAGQQTGVVPRLLGAPGFTGQVSSNGSQVQANPVCVELVSISSRLLAHSVVSGPGAGQLEAMQWRETLASSRLIPVDAWVSVQDGVSSRYEDGAAHILGLAVRTDFQHGGLPFWSFANQQVGGILGLKLYYPFSLTDGATAGQELLASHIGMIARGEMGIETALSDTGFVFTGLWNAENDPNLWFYNKTRGRDWAHLALMKSLRRRLGSSNVTPKSVDAVLNDMIVIGQDLVRNDCSVGFRVGFEANGNSETDLRQGKFRVFFAQEEPAPIAQITIDSRSYYKALEFELATLGRQAAALPGTFIS